METFEFCGSSIQKAARPLKKDKKGNTTLEVFHYYGKPALVQKRPSSDHAFRVETYALEQASFYFLRLFSYF